MMFSEEQCDCVAANPDRIRPCLDLVPKKDDYITVRCSLLAENHSAASESHFGTYQKAFRYKRKFVYTQIVLLFP